MNGRTGLIECEDVLLWSGWWGYVTSPYWGPCCNEVMMINAEMSTLFEVSRHTAASAQPLLPTRGTLLGSHGGCGLIGHIVNVNECIDINIAVRIYAYEWNHWEKWLCDHFGIQLKFYTTYEANVSTDCAYLKYVPHVRGVSACNVHDLCMTRGSGGPMSMLPVRCCCLLLPARRAHAAWERGTWAAEQPGQQSWQGDFAKFDSVVRLAKILYAAHQLGYLQRSIQISRQITYHVKCPFSISVFSGHGGNSRSPVDSFRGCFHIM